MAKKSVYVVTHGDKHKGPNPGMTETGFQQVAALYSLVPSRPSVVVIGTGQRHIDVAAALNLIGTEDMPNELVAGRFPVRVTPIVGGPESLEGNLVFLADGTKVARKTYTGTEDGTTCMVRLVLSLPDNTVICAGRPSMILLGKNDAKSAAVYRITYNDNGYTTDYTIEEVLATGQVESDTV